MLVSRGSGLIKNVLQCNVRNNSLVNKQQVRNIWEGTWVYRKPTKPHKSALIMAEILGGFGFWWILWHCWHDWHHLVGFDLPEPSDWTDAELGIPPDDADC